MVSSPPPTDMLKFSGFSSPTSCLCINRAPERHPQFVSPNGQQSSAGARLGRRAGTPSVTVPPPGRAPLRWASGNVSRLAQQRRPAQLRGQEPRDPEAGVLPGAARKRSMNSSFSWFTEFRTSQCLSHLAAPFINAQAKTSIAEGFVTSPRAHLPARRKTLPK